MRVLRLEREDGLGVYTVVYINPRDNRPGPSRDNIPHHVIQDKYFGFINFDQLLNWFSIDDPRDHYEAEDRFNMINSNIGISEYEAEDYGIFFGNSQIIFERKTAKRLCWIPLKEMLS